jgi:thiol-disulfide isomerase/thioredoxin
MYLFALDTSLHLLKLAKDQKDTELVDAVTVYKNTSLGVIAPDFVFDVLKDGEKPVAKKLSKLDDAERYLILFWSTTCSHCLDEIPQLKEYVSTLKENKLKVIAVALEDEPYRWKDLTYDYPDFYHVYGEGKWDNEIGNNYNITATPTYFVLDKNKTIIAKPEDIVAFKKYMEDNSITIENPKKEEEKKESEKGEN